MPAEASVQTRWNALHDQPRFRPVYPSEHVVRFLAGLPEPHRRRHALDIGCGAGRHLRLLHEYGYTSTGVDSSRAALEHARAELGDNAMLTEAAMTELPFQDGFFDVAVSYGVFYYTTPELAEQAISEMHRVLKPGGRGFVNVRSVRDWRHQHTSDGVFRLRGHPEDGMPLHFLTVFDINDRYSLFSQVGVELTTTTTSQLRRINSDWLITVTK